MEGNVELSEWEKDEIAQDEIDAYNRPNGPVILLVLSNVVVWSVFAFYFFRFLKEILQWLTGILG
jgi:hypothetical protein